MKAAHIVKVTAEIETDTSGIIGSIPIILIRSGRVRRVVYRSTHGPEDCDDDGFCASSARKGAVLIFIYNGHILNPRWYVFVSG